MAQSDYPNYYNDRPQRTRERAKEWREERNGEYQAEGWAPDYERDSSLGEYYPTDNYRRSGGDFGPQDYAAPRSLQNNRQTGYDERYSGRQTSERHRSYSQANRQGSHAEDFRGMSYGSSSSDYSRNYGSDSAQTGEHRGRGPKGYQRSDQRIHEDICERLSDDHHVDASDITVSVSGGVVTLEGTVTNRRMKHDAEDIVAECSGVKDVQNRIRVAGSTQPASSESSTTAAGEAQGKLAAEKSTTSKH